MRDLGRNVDNVAGGQGLLRTAFNRWTANLVRRGGFSAHHLAAHDQRGVARLHYKQIGFGLVQTRIWKQDPDLPAQPNRRTAQLSGTRNKDVSQDSRQARADPGGGLLGRALATVLAQRVRNFVSQHGGELVVRDLQLLDDAGVDRDLPAGHAPCVDLGRGQDVHFPLPVQRVLAKDGGLRDESLGDGANALDLLWVFVDVALRRLLLDDILVLHRRGLIQLRRRHEQELAPLDPDGALLGGRRACGKRCGRERRDPQAGGHPSPHRVPPVRLRLGEYFDDRDSRERVKDLDAPRPPAQYGPSGVPASS